jgi:hypothetical protein
MFTFSKPNLATNAERADEKVNVDKSVYFLLSDVWGEGEGRVSLFVDELDRA